MFTNTYKLIVIFSLICSISNLNAKENSFKKYIIKNNDFDFLWENYENNDQFKPKSSHWTGYKQTYGLENIKMKFPGNPTIINDEHVIYVYCNKKKNLYAMSTANPPRGNIDINAAFPLAIAALSQIPNTLLGYKISIINGMHVLDLTSQHQGTKIFTKARLIITKNNFYLLRTIYPAGEKESHEYFINSFFIN